LHELAASLATSRQRRLEVDLPESLASLDYDRYRSIRSSRAAWLWNLEGAPFAVEPMHLGGRYRTRVRIDVLGEGPYEDGLPWRELTFQPGDFALPEGVAGLPLGAGFAGLRVLAPQRRPDAYSEFLVFHGASYFRGVGREHTFGASARGLALGTGERPGEEFPAFTQFVVEEPDTTDASIRLHALIESESLTGVYSFRATPGDEMVMDVDATLYPRRDLERVGYAPLTSMYMFAEGSGRRFDDFRGAVHDSDGLQIVTGAGERLWRPLLNPRKLQLSEFVDKDPRGFGLIQRRRQFERFGDLEARYDRRPSVWIEPLGVGWGDGSIVLVELPTDGETNDNIVAFWRPASPPRAGEPVRLQYRVRWCDRAPDDPSLGRVIATRSGLAQGSDARLIVVDFSGLPEGTSLASARPVATAGGGRELQSPRLEWLPGEGGIRAVFTLRLPEEVEHLDLSLQLVDSESADPLTEKWVYRWTR